MCTTGAITGPSMGAMPSSMPGTSTSMPSAATSAGGGGSADLSTALDGLRAAVATLKQVVEQLRAGAGTHGVVAGVQGAAATRKQFVAHVGHVPAASSEDNAFEAQVLALINRERARYGLRPVRYEGRLDSAAEKHARHMSLAGKMAHDGIGDGDPGERIRAEGFRNAWGENVATGQTSPAQVVREWMASPEHRRNILDPNYSKMGVSYVTAANGRSYWAQAFGA